MWSRSILAEGQLAGNRYRAVCFIDRGGMGEVYEVEDRTLGDVALKTIAREVAEDQDSFDRFRREIHIARRITHSNVSRVYDVGVHESTGEDGTREELLFLTMERLRGDTLTKRIARGPIAISEALPIVQQMAAALEAAHKAGVIHRDFKSGNVMLAAGAREGGAPSSRRLWSPNGRLEVEATNVGPVRGTRRGSRVARAGHQCQGSAPNEAEAAREAISP